MANIDKIKLPKSITNKYTLENESFKREIKSDPKDKIEIEIGDMKQLDFKPQFKIMRWDNEVNFSIRGEENVLGTVDFQGEKIKYKTQDYEIHLYDKPGASKDGGFEFEWVLLKKPPTNIVKATIETKDLNFFFQPPLTQSEIDEGCIRVGSVVNSYAVYHKSKGNINLTSEKDYKVGKAFHIYRPKAIDANGVETWGELNIDEINKTLTVLLDQTFLDIALYPVTIDPTFGYTSVGATEDGNFQTIANTVTPAGTGNADNENFYIYCDSGSHTFKGAVWDDASGTPGNRDILGAVSGTIPIGVGAVSWVVSNFASEAFVVETLHPGVTVDSSTTNLFSAFYDTTTGTNAFENVGTGVPANPFGAATTRTNRSYSNYVNYTAAGAAVFIPRLSLLRVG